jgi:hypothetical protein
MSTEKVEVGFDLTGSGGPFLRLDDAIAGQLDDPEWVLGGTLFYDITNRVKSYTIDRGKSREFDGYQTGECSVVFDNRDRAFDPTFEASPFYGNIVPKRELRISTNGILSFFGVVDDWNLQYELGGQSEAVVVASDGFSYLNNQTLTGGTATPQTTGQRISAILDDPSVNWPSTRRTIDTGSGTLGADVIAADAPALDYLRLVEKSEPGSLFVGKNGYLVFKDRTVAPSSTDSVHLSDAGDGIAYQEVKVIYGSELLYNEIVIGSTTTNSTAVAYDYDSIGEYGVLNYTQTDLLMNTDEQVEQMAVFLAQKYSQPEFRFETVTVRTNGLSSADENALLNIELGDVVKLTFSPNNVPPAIVKYAEVIKIGHNVDVDGEHTITYGFSALDFTYLVLDDAVFGKLDSNNSLAY